jgi:signal transduction histidine kinase
MALLDAIPLGLFILDREGRFVYLNTYAERFFAQVANGRRDQLLGRPIWQACPEVADSPFIREYERASAEQRDFDLEVCYPTLGRWFALRASPAKDYTPFFLQDITSRVNLERAARQQAQELAEVQEAKNEGLLRVARRLRRALRSVREALGLLRAQGEAGNEIRRACARGGREMRSLHRLVRRLLGAGRGTPGPGAPPARGKGGGQRVTVALPPGPLEGLAEPQLSQEVCSHLLNDVIRLTAPGGRIWLTAARHEGRVEVSLRDNGSGIAPELLPRIADLLAQLNSPKDRTPPRQEVSAG